MKILITGINRGLGKNLLGEFYKIPGYIVVGSVRSASTVELEKCELLICDFSSVIDIEQFYNKVCEIGPDVIVHNASPYEGSFKSSSIDDIKNWNNFSLAALMICKYAVNTNSKVILIGSIVGIQGCFMKNNTLYSQYKSSIGMMADAARLEDGNAVCLYVDSFRDDGDGINTMSTKHVVSVIHDLVKRKEKFDNNVILRNQTNAQQGDAPETTST